MVFSSAAGDLAVGGSEAGPSLAPSEDGGRVEARAPDATMNARLRKGTRTTPQNTYFTHALISHT